MTIEKVIELYQHQQFKDNGFQNNLVGFIIVIKLG